jgi:hypothetical protein
LGVGEVLGNRGVRGEDGIDGVGDLKSTDVSAVIADAGVAAGAFHKKLSDGAL